MKKIGYEKLHEDVEVLVDKIKTNINGKHIYDNVYAIPRGGIYAGALVAQALEVELVDTAEDVGPYTLIVDDLIDSGTTRRKFWDQDFAVLYTKGNSDIVPTYSVEEIPEWIEFPWENTVQEVDDNMIRLLEYNGVPVTPENMAKVVNYLEKL